MSSSDGSGSSGSSSDEEEQLQEQHVPQIVTGANADPQVLQYFWDLASLQQAERQAAAEALVAALVDSQAQHDASYRAKDAMPSGSFDQEAGNRQQRMEQCLACCSPLMAYGLKRLARGLASSRQGARQGFAAALAATLAHSAAAGAQQQEQQQPRLQRPFVSAAGVLALLDACLEVTGSMKGTEQRDALLGRIFGLAALTRSGLITAVPVAAAGDAGSDSQALVVSAATAAVAEQLAGLLQRKSFLRESAAAALVELLQPLGAVQMAAVLQQAPRTALLLQSAPADATPEALFMALRLWHCLPEQQLLRCALLPALPPGHAPPPQQFWEEPRVVKRRKVEAAAAAVFSAEHVQQLTPALLLSSASHPRLHPVWGCLLALLMPGFVPVRGPEQQQQQQQQKLQQRSPPDLQQLQVLWSHFVEDACLSSSHERKALALQLLLLLLPVLSADMVPLLLSRTLLGCMSSAVKDKDSYLHASAKRCLERISKAADSSLVAQADPAAAARLRLALAAALQSVQLAAPGAKGAAPLQGLDAAGVAAYVDQTLQECVQAAARAAGAAANRRAGGDDGSDEDVEVDGADDSKVLQWLEQLVTGLKLPAADAPTLRKGLSFLAALAWLQLPQGFDPAADTTSKKAGKKQKQQQKSGAAAVVQQPEVQAGLQLAARVQHSEVLQRTAAARLVALLHHLHTKAGALAASASQHKQQQQQQQQPKQKQQQKQQKQQGDTAQDTSAARAALEVLPEQLLEIFAAVQQLPGVSVTVDDDITEMVEQLGQLAAVIDQHVPSTTAAAAAGGAGNGGVSAQQRLAALAPGRKRVVLQLVRQLQLQLLSGGLSAEAAGSVVDDLEVSVLKGLGLNGQLLEQLRAADAAAKLRLAGDVSAAGGDGDGAGSSSEEGSEGGGSSSEEDDDGDGDVWQDVLLDLLLSLLSNSSGDGGGGGRGGGGGGSHVPSVPLREACEALFKAFAEEMTAQGLSDLMRVLSQRASEILKAADEEDDDMEVEQSEGGDESSRSDDESSELDEEQQQQLKDLHKNTTAGADSGSEPNGGARRQPVTAANGAAAAAAGGSSDDDDDEGLDDEAMLRLDAQLGAAVRASLARGGGGAKERAAALLALQLRVAALMEDWLKKCPKSPLVLPLVLPLIKALVSARGAGGSPVLADRLTGLITKHLARARPSWDPQQQQLAPAAAPPAAADGDVTPAVAALEADARRVLYHASRDKDPRVAAAAAQGLLVLLVAGTESGDTAAAAVARAAAAAALQDFLSHKKSRLQQGWCQVLLSRCFDAVVGGEEAAGLVVLLTACSKGRNETVRAKAVQLLPLLINGRQGVQVEVLLGALKQQQGVVAAALGAGVLGPWRSKEQHAGAAKAVTGLLSGLMKQGGGRRLAELVGGEAVRELGKDVVVLKAAGVPHRVEVQLDRLVETAGLQQLVAAGKPDPARLASLNKARAALEGGARGAGAAAGGGKGGKTAGSSGKQQEQPVQLGHQQEHQGKKAKRKALATAEQQQQQQDQEQEQEPGAEKPHKKKPKKQHDQQKQQQQQQRREKKHKQRAAAPEEAGVAAAAAAAAAAAGGGGGSGVKGPKAKRKQDDAGGADQGRVQKKEKNHKKQP